jgi:hypothetical protein
MAPDFKHFLARVKGDPFAQLNMSKGKVQLPELRFSHEVTLEPDTFFSYRLLMKKFETMSIEVEVTEGGDIDILVMNEYNFLRYIRAEEFIYMRGGSILNIKKISNMFVAQDEEMHHIALDNTYYPSGGARPNPAINGGKIKVRFIAKTHSPIQMDFALPMRI